MAQRRSVSGGGPKRRSQRGLSTSWSIHRAAREASGCSVSAAWERRASCSRRCGGRRRRIATLPLMPPLFRVDRSMPLMTAQEDGLTTPAETFKGSAWSPTGDRIALGLRRLPATGIYTFAPNGSGFTPVIRHGLAPSWSPDGSQIAYESYVMHSCSEDPDDCWSADLSGRPRSRRCRWIARARVRRRRLGSVESGLEGAGGSAFLSCKSAGRVCVAGPGLRVRSFRGAGARRRPPRGRGSSRAWARRFHPTVGSQGSARSTRPPSCR
jgi:hypothetical protein